MRRDRRLPDAGPAGGRHAPTHRRSGPRPSRRGGRGGAAAGRPLRRLLDSPADHAHAGLAGLSDPGRRGRRTDVRTASTAPSKTAYGPFECARDCRLLLGFDVVHAVATTSGRTRRSDPEWDPIRCSRTITAERVALGRKQYCEEGLVVDGTIACAICQDPEAGFTDLNQFSEGVGGRLGDCQAPVVMAASCSATQFCDGLVASREEQAGGPVGNPPQMAITDNGVVDRLSEAPI